MIKTVEGLIKELQKIPKEYEIEFEADFIDYHRVKSVFISNHSKKYAKKIVTIQIL